jgi:hypothetical protein
MKDLAWLPQDAGHDPTAFSGDAALIQYQQEHGLEPTGELDPATVNCLLHDQGRCGCVEQLGDGSPTLKLQTNRPLVFVRDALPGFSRDQIWSWVEEAYRRWGAVCDFKARRILDFAEAASTDYVNLITVADLGAGGVLADQQLPYTGGRVLMMRLNSRIRWMPTDGPMSGGGIDPVRTIAHEGGHFQGHQHWPVGGPPELMEPTVSNTIIRPQPTEGAVSAGWFGPPPPPPPPPVPTDPTKFKYYMSLFDGLTRKPVGKSFGLTELPEFIR